MAGLFMFKQLKNSSNEGVAHFKRNRYKYYGHSIDSLIRDEKIIIRQLKSYFKLFRNSFKKLTSNKCFNVCQCVKSTKYVFIRFLHKYKSKVHFLSLEKNLNFVLVARINLKKITYG